MARTPSPLPSAHRRIRGFEATSGLLKDQIRKVGESRGFAIARLLTHWPEIAGEDLAGVAFKLSDYRGKVVLLDFWGYW